MLEIRPLNDADIDAVAEVHVRTWQAGYAGIVPADYLAALDPAVFAERRRAHARHPGAQTLVAELDGEVIGFVAFGPDRTEAERGELYAIYVHPDHWGAGAGRRLIEAAKVRLTADGFADMRLWVLADNARARHFYERAGLEFDGTTDFYSPGTTGVQLPEVRYTTAL
jgi:ribosomal protein S18 acetylase RimI-like enzyme